MKILTRNCHLVLPVVIVFSVIMLKFQTDNLLRYGTPHLYTSIIQNDSFETDKVFITTVSTETPFDSNDSNQKKFHNIFECLNKTLCREGLESNVCLPKKNTRDRFECSHFMNVKTNDGRIGNKIFQVAALIGMAFYHGYTPIIDPSSPLTKLFDLPNVLDIKLDNAKKYNPTYGKFDNRTTMLEHTYNWTLQGYILSWRYFKGAEAEIRKTFRVKQELVEQVNDFMQFAVQGNVTKICVHVRRGDYLKPNLIRAGRIVAPVHYLKNAMEHFREKYTRVHFFVLSNDMQWCKTNMKWNNITFSSYKIAELDFTLMTLCDHVIFTSGTFGWWGAWLAGGEVIYWTGYPRKGSPLDSLLNRYDMYPRDWIGLP